MSIFGKLLGSVFKGAVDMIPFVSSGKKLVKELNLQDAPKSLQTNTVNLMIRRIDWIRLVSQLLTFAAIIYALTKASDLSPELIEMVVNALKEPCN